MPDLTSLTMVAGWALIIAVALGLVYLAVTYRLQPVFLLPLAGGLVLGHTAGLGWAGVLDPFFRTLQSGLDSGFYFALIFLGWGAGANLTNLIAHPRQLILGLFTPLAFFAVFILGGFLGLTPSQAGSVALIGGGDGLSAAFLSAQLAPELIGPVCLAAFTLVGLQLLLQPHLVRLLTTREERLLRMPPVRKVSRRENLFFAGAGLVLTLVLVPRAALLTGMFFLGNMIRESGVVDRLARTLANRLAEIVAVLLGLAVGSRCRAVDLLSLTFVKVLGLGLIALLLATLVVILAIKTANLFLSKKINPLVGAAAVGLLPDAAHVVQIIGRREDSRSNLFAHALASSQAALLAATLTAGLLWGILGGR